MKKLKTSILAITFGVLALSCTQSESAANGDSTTESTTTEQAQDESVAKDVSAEEFKTLIESGKGTLVDVRTAGEYARGNINGAQNIDFYGANFKEEISKLDKNEPVYVYCASGNRSGKAMRMMKDMGFKEIYNLTGGYGRYPFK